MLKKISAKPDKLTNDLVSLIFNAGQILKEKAREKNNLKNCSFLHMQTLHYIKNKNNVAMREVADFLHITPPSTTSLVNALVKDSLVKRIIDEHDRRTIKLQITPAGINLLKNRFKVMVVEVEKGVNSLSENEKKNFIVILNKIIK